MQVNGDAFIGRTYDNGDDFKRLDFKVSEVSSSAAWVQVRFAVLATSCILLPLCVFDHVYQVYVSMLQPCSCNAATARPAICCKVCVDVRLCQSTCMLVGFLSLCIQNIAPQEARAQNEKKRQRDSPAALESRMRAAQPAATSSSTPSNRNLSPAETLKEKGNTALKQGNLQEVTPHTCECFPTCTAHRNVCNFNAMSLL